MKKTIAMLSILLLAAGLYAAENVRMVTYGPSASVVEGDDDFKQVVFFKIPAAYTDSLFIRLFDPDVGGGLDLAFQDWNTRTRFTLYGGEGAFSAPTLKKPSPDENDLRAGTVLADRTFGNEREYDGVWTTFARLVPSQGEQIGDARYFKLVVQGMEGNDANVFDLRLSIKSWSNTAVEGFSMFSYAPTIRLEKEDGLAQVSFDVPPGTTSVCIHNFDLAGAQVALETPFRSNLQLTASGQGEWVESRNQLDALETGRRCAISFGQGGETPNDATFYVTNQDSLTLPIELPIAISRANTRPQISKRIIALSDCNAIVFDAKETVDRDGDVMQYYWDFGDGATATGSRVVHRYEKQQTYDALLIVTDNSGQVGNGSFERFKVFVNQPPKAVAGADMVTAPGEAVFFDGSASSDADGTIQQYFWDFGDGKSAAGKTVTYRYALPGNFTAVLRVEDNADTPCNFDTATKKVWVNAKPIAIAGPDQSGSVGQKLSFSAEKSMDQDGELTGYSWDFGDGATAEGRFIDHAFSRPGRYTVRLTVTDNAGVSNSRQQDDLAALINDPPVAKATAPEKAAIAEKINLDASASTDRDGQIVDYLWDFGDGTSARGAQAKHAFAASGRYRVVLTVRDNSATTTDTARDTLRIFVNQPPVAQAGPDQTVTASVVEFDGSGSKDSDGELVRYDWTFSDGGKDNGVKTSHVFARPGTYKNQLTVTDNSGTQNDQATDEMVVIVNDKPIADAGRDQTGAPGQSLAFDGSSSFDSDGTISAYAWKFGDGQSAEGQKVHHAFSAPGTYAVRLEVRDNSGDDNAVDFDEAIVRINAAPVALAGADIVIVPGQTATFDGSASYDPDQDSLSYQWRFSDNEGAADVVRTNRAFAQPGLYSAVLTVKDNTGTLDAVAHDTLAIKVNNAPVAVIGADVLTCDHTITFDGSASTDADGDALSYSWNFGDGAFGSGVQVSHTFPQGGVFPVILTVDDGLGLKNSRHSASNTVTINQPPVADAGADEVFCSGEIILFNGGNSKDPENGLLKYHWDFGDGTTAEGVNPTKIYKNGGVYQIKLTVEDDSGLPCNRSVDTKVIRVIESPVAFAGEDMQVCTNTSVKFDGSRSRDFDGVVNNYFWDFGDGSTGGGAQPTHVYNKAGLYRVVLTITGDLIGECDNTDTDELLVTAFDAPTALFTAPEVYPISQPLALDASASTTPLGKIVGYDWDFGDGVSGHGETVSHIFAKSGSYRIKLTVHTDANTECNQASLQKVLTINQAPVANAGADQLVGANQVVLLDGSASHDDDGAIVSYIWDLQPGVQKSGVQVQHLFGEPGRYPVALTVTDATDVANHSDQDTVIIVVNHPPAAAVSGPSQCCPGETIHLNAGASSDADGQRLAFKWNFGDGKTAEGAEVTHAFNVSGAYQVILTADDGLGLENSRSQLVYPVRVNNRPQAAAVALRDACPAETIDFDGSASIDRDGDALVYQWDFGDDSKGEGARISHAFERPGEYRVRLTVTDPSGTACASDDAVTVVRVDSAPIAVAGEDRQVWIGGAHDAVLFDGGKSTDADGDALTYRWDFGDGNVKTGASVYHLFAKPGVYVVKLRVDDGRQVGCRSAEDSMVVTVKARP